VGEANQRLGEQGQILGIRMDSHLTILRQECDYAIYSVFVPNDRLSFHKIRSGMEKFHEKRMVGKDVTIRLRETAGMKGVFRMVEKKLSGEDVLKTEYRWMPEHRGTLVRCVVSANYNPIAMLEGLTSRKAAYWRSVPIYCDGYIQIDDNKSETDVFAALSGDSSHCQQCGGTLERAVFSGEKNTTGVCVMCDLDQYEVDMDKFKEQTMWAVTEEVGTR